MMKRLTQFQVDYTPWERHSIMHTTSLTSSPTVDDKFSPTSAESISNRLVSSSNSSIKLHKHEAKQLPAIRKSHHTTTKNVTDTIQLKLLQLQINNKKQMLQESLNCEDAIMKDNMALKETLEADEDKTHTHVKQLLRKYERFQGGMKTISTQFSAESASAHSHLEKTRNRVSSELTRLETDLKKVDEQLKQKQHALQVLLNYKDKEFPIKGLQIAELEKKIELIIVEQAREVAELQRIIELEEEKMEKHIQKSIGSVWSDIAKDTVLKVNPSVDDIARENRRLKREISLHKADISHMEESIKSCQNQIKQLLADPKLDVHYTMFPELYHAPYDSDDIDIPKQKWLPI